MSEGRLLLSADRFFARRGLERPPGVHPSARFHGTARVDVRHLVIGAGGVVGEGCVLEGTRVEVGRELWMDAGARVGGGSCRDPDAHLVAGDHLHLGKGSEVNTARGVSLGDEVGVGVGTCVFTHGAYLSELDGFPCAFAPVKVGSRVWLPHAWVNPGVTVGDDVVVAAGAVVVRDLPGGCLAGGVPARVLREGAYPRPLNGVARAEALDRVLAEVRWRLPLGASAQLDGDVVVVTDAAGQTTRFDVSTRGVDGPATDAAEAARDQLRRRGVRFRYSPSAGGYERWT